MSARAPHRPLAITPAKAARYLQALAGGNYKKTAAAYAGVHPTTLRNWERIAEQETVRVSAEGHDPEEVISAWLDGQSLSYRPDATVFRAAPPEPFEEGKVWLCVLLSHLAKKADADAEVSAVANVMAAGQQSWQASMTYLERRYPERWGRRDRVALEGAKGGPVQVETRVSVDQLVAKITQLRAEASE